MDMFITAAENRELSDYDKQTLAIILENYDNAEICGRIEAMGIELMQEEEEGTDD